jgi:C_GCAxxG_C_C family probable redox protein
MQLEGFVSKRVHDYYWQRDLNCATTTLKILSEKFEIPLNEQVIDAAIGMHGAGGFRAQCGLVEGMLMFLGIFGRHHELPDQKTVKLCYNFASEFQTRFGSLLCRELRPEGFHPDNPPHLCEQLTKNAIIFAVEYIADSQRKGEE